ncbi:MAG: hypothetical protein ACOC5S_01745 [Acidobacteriota bacterium]
MRKENKVYGKSYEPTLQVFELPLSRFIDCSTDFEPSLLRKINFLFDQNKEGVIILDRVGIGTNSLDIR